MTMIKTTHQPHRAHNRNHRASRLALNEALGGQNEPYHHEAQWVILRHGKIQGPFGTAEVIDKISHLQVGPRDALWRPSQTGWQSIENFVQQLGPDMKHQLYKMRQQHKAAQQAAQTTKTARQAVGAQKFKTLQKQARSYLDGGSAQGRCHASTQQGERALARPPEAAGEDAVAARLRRCAMPVLSS